jgi:N-acetylglucosamine-6-phosphate deacetylase
MTVNNFKYFDLQVNGYAGIDFNSLNITHAQVEKACLRLIDDNVEGILATIITDDMPKMIRKIKNITSIINSSVDVKKIIKGLHIEGPFLNRGDGFRGAHPEGAVIAADIEKMQSLLDAGEGLIKLVTLAPECDPDCRVIEHLASQDIIVSAGHSNAAIVQLRRAIDKGLKMYTHLGNGTPALIPRHDNIINRVLSLSDQLYIGFIADGIHIPDFALKNYLKIAGADRVIIVSDAIAAASAPPGSYWVSDISVNVGEDRIVRETGKDNLAGSAITMKESREFLAKNIGFDENVLKKMFSFNAKNLIQIK